MVKSKTVMQKGGEKAKEVVEQQLPVEKVLEEAFMAMDKVIAEASTYSHTISESMPPNKRLCTETSKSKNNTAEMVLKRDLFTAALLLPLQQIAYAISTYGSQLLPAIHEISSRLLRLVSSPLLACAEAWESCARLCLYYGVGAVPVLREVLDFVLREPGVLLLDCPCCVTPELMEYLMWCATLSSGNGRHSTSPPLSVAAHSFTKSQDDMDALLEQTERKLRSLRLMVTAAGDAVDLLTMQQFAFRFSQEIIQDGILPLPCKNSDLQMTMNVFQGNRAEAGNGNLLANNVRVQWRIPSEWKAECVLLLDTLLGALRPTDMDLLRSATLLVQTLYAHLQRGSEMIPSNCLHTCRESPGETLSYPEIGASTLAAVAQLQRTLFLMRHPPLLPSKSIPLSIVLEERKKRIFVEKETLVQCAEASHGDIHGNLNCGALSHARESPILTPELHREAKTSSNIPSSMVLSSSGQDVRQTDVTSIVSHSVTYQASPVESSTSELFVTPEISTKGSTAAVSSGNTPSEASFASLSANTVHHDDDELPDIDLED